MYRVKVRWAGFIGSPGWSNFYFNTTDGSFLTQDDAPVLADRVTTFFTAIKNNFPIGLTWTVQSDVEAINEATGELLNVLNAGARAPLTGGTAQAPYSAASGAVVTWRTAGVKNGRRVRGRTFLVPAATAAYQSDGTLLDSAQTTIQGAANTLQAPVGNIAMGVWARPGLNDIPNGEWHQITTASVPDKVAVLTSRRD